MGERNPSAIERKFKLSTSSEVEAIAQRTTAKTGEKPSTDKDVRIQNYLDYLTDSLGLPDEARDIENQPHRFETNEQTKAEKLVHFKNVLYDKYVLKYENIPESYWKTQSRIVREEGRSGDFPKDENGDMVFPDEDKEEQAAALIADQKSSLDNWIEYLTSPDAKYPDWLKYYAFRSILGMAEYEKQKKSFPERNKGTTKAFPDINREALAQVLDALEKKCDKKDINLDILSQEDKDKLNQLLQGENFAKLYSFFIEKFSPASQEQLKITTGKWITYPKGSDHLPLVKSLQGHSTGWCTAGEAVAEKYLKAGDLHVYYSIGEDDKPIIPRAAVCMKGSTISEVRGVAFQQNLDPYIGGVVQQKLTEFPDGKAYEKKSQDMKTLTVLETKIKAAKQLTREDLIFLYEIDKSIQGFGYQKDPRIEELRKTRKDILFDKCLIFNCLPEHIAHNEQEVNDKTKAYIGPLFPNIFKKLSHLENIFISFPEGKIKKETVPTGGKNKDQLIKEIEERKITISVHAAIMMENKDFTTSKGAEQTGFVHLKVKDLFSDSQTRTTDQVYSKAQALGLELCQSQDGPNYRLHYADQPQGEHIYMGMKHISGAGGNPHVFELRHDDDGLWLRGGWRYPGVWNSDDELVFRLSKYEA